MAGSITLVFNDDGTVGWKPADGGRTRGKYNWIDEPECPDHGRWEVVPAGTRKDGTAYKAFYTCRDDDCLNRPGRDWVDHNPPGDYANHDDLPF